MSLVGLACRYRRSYNRPHHWKYRPVSEYRHPLVPPWYVDTLLQRGKSDSEPDIEVDHGHSHDHHNCHCHVHDDDETCQENDKAADPSSSSTSMVHSPHHPSLHSQG